MAVPADPVNLQEREQRASRADGETYPETYSLRLSEAATYSDWWASSLGIILGIVSARHENRREHSLVVDLLISHQFAQLG